MIKTKALMSLLSQSLDSSITSSILLTSSGQLLSQASKSQKNARIHAAFAAQIWSLYEKIGLDGDIGSLTGENKKIYGCNWLGIECLTGNLLILCIRFPHPEKSLHVSVLSEPILLCLVGNESSKLGFMHMKAKSIEKYLLNELEEIRDI
ncbi:hypothetical protein T552_00485 [Pneumocystis carinii B80]|uniref:Roadblock/LAMTOR2 domain-containing protein n=1 Tax=Pneumocystis carinii (strain B80) TaxID=1408658 RepID=A0A0W4ZQX2_PNEC8|nr:hypothetical protein T552_00485 [Pneumocystis carinii B80]KTW30773.1 hypothetical protein T552_00485 [Pneumocystis carinii B80]